MATSADEDDEYEKVEMHAVEFDRYAQIRLDGGDVIVYDTEREDAWIQSDGAIGIEYMV